MEDNLNSDTFFQFLTFFIENPFILTIFFVLVWISYLIYKDKINFREIFSMRKLKRNITKVDLLEHPLFMDLDFWAEHRVSEIYDVENYLNSDEAKLLIAKDLLITKFKVAKETIYNTIKTYVDNVAPNKNVPSESLIDVIDRCIDKVKSLQYNEFNKLNIPKHFLEKWFEVCRIRDVYLRSSLDDIMSSDLILSNYDKMYLILSNLNVYYSALLSDMGKTVQSINGDLKGEIYKGLTIGGHDYRQYPIPDRNYIPLVKQKLYELISLSGSNQAGIFVFHDFIGDDYLNGQVSSIYHNETDFSPELLKDTQYCSCTILFDIIPQLKQHQAIVGDISNFNRILQIQMKKSNCYGIIAAPMFINSIMKGVLVIGYNDKDEYEKVDKDVMIDLVTKYSSLLNIYVDYGKTGFKYC